MTKEEIENILKQNAFYIEPTQKDIVYINVYQKSEKILEEIYPHLSQAMRGEAVGFLKWWRESEISNTIDYEKLYTKYLIEQLTKLKNKQDGNR